MHARRAREWLARRAFGMRQMRPGSNIAAMDGRAAVHQLQVVPDATGHRIPENGRIQRFAFRVKPDSSFRYSVADLNQRGGIVGLLHGILLW